MLNSVESKLEKMCQHKTNGMHFEGFIRMETDEYVLLNPLCVHTLVSAKTREMCGHLFLSVENGTHLCFQT